MQLKLITRHIEILLMSVGVSILLPGRRESTMAEGGGNKRLSVERIYQKKSQLEHILLRPDTYIGSVQVGFYCRVLSIL